MGPRSRETHDRGTGLEACRAWETGFRGVMWRRAGRGYRLSWEQKVFGGLCSRAFAKKRRQDCLKRHQRSRSEASQAANGALPVWEGRLGLSVKVSSVPSVGTFWRPRKLRRRNPRVSLMTPRIGSMVCLRSAQSVCRRYGCFGGDKGTHRCHMGRAIHGSSRRRRSGRAEGCRRLKGLVHPANSG